MWVKLCLKPKKPPFDFNLKMGFSAGGGKPTPAVFEGGVWRRAFRVEGRLVPVAASPAGTVDAPILTVSVPREFRRVLREVARRVSLLLGADGDPRPLYDFMGRDPVLRVLKERLYGLGCAGRMSTTVYEGVVKAIIQQQVSIRVAEKVTGNLVEAFGDRVLYGGEAYYEFPTPQTLAEASLEGLRACGVSWRKAEYIREFSRAVSEGRFNPEELYGKDPEEIVRILSGFRGVGRWTAELVMVASMGMNVVPADDLGVRKAVSEFYFNGELQDADTVRGVAKKWGRHARDVVVHLLYANRLGLKPKRNMAS